MKDQQNAALLRQKALELSIELLKTLVEYDNLVDNETLSPMKDAKTNAENAAVMIACEALGLEDVDQAEDYVKKHI